MKSVQVLMPMAGSGSRFRGAGYGVPKPLIDVAGMPMFTRSFSSLDGLEVSREVVAIIRRQDDQKHGFGARIRGAVPTREVVLLDAPTRGAVETCLQAKSWVDSEEPLIVLDCDLYFGAREYFKAIRSLAASVSGDTGALVYFRSELSCYSFLEEKNGQVIRTAEKVRISDRAIAGCYFFSSGALFLSLAHELLARSAPSGVAEYYVSALFNLLIARGGKVVAAPADLHHSYGTPEDLELSLKVGG